jgi:trans-aconitate methyltransferase
VFSNAAIHWVEDHPSLVPRLFSLVRPGGQLVVQIPSNHNHATHRLIIETAREEPFPPGAGRLDALHPGPAYRGVRRAALPPGRQGNHRL